MNTQRIKDPDIRHAIALAIDRQGIQSIYGGEVYGAVADSVIPPDVPGYVAPDLALEPAAIPKRRRSCSKASRYHRCTWPSPTRTGAATSKKISLIEANLKAGGLEVVVDPYSDEDLCRASAWDRGLGHRPIRRMVFRLAHSGFGGLAH